MPRHWGGVFLSLLLAGCVSTDGSPAAVNWQTLRPDTEPGPDRVLLDVALVQSPLGDDFLDQQLWSCADEMAVSPAAREILELNGYRVGRLIGSPPDKLVALLGSPRTCLDRRGRSAPSGMTLNHELRDAEEIADCVLHRGRVREPLGWDRGRFGVDLTAHVQPENRIRLRVTPRIEASEKTLNFKPLPAESKWALEVKRPSRVLGEAAWEIDLAPNQVLLVGARLDREGTAGYHSFVRPDGTEPMQRVLILRHMRSAASVEPGEPTP